MKIEALGDSAAVVSLGRGIDESALPLARALAEAITRVRAPAVFDAVPAFATVAVYYDPVRLAGFSGNPHENICRFISSCAEGIGDRSRRRASDADPAQAGSMSGIRSLTPSFVEIPVCYGGEFGPDLGELAAHSGLSADEVVARHSGADYRVHAIGFVPGFPYLAGLPRELHMPRRDTPRTSVPAGSVGIGGAQTGVYPMATPGGWRLIGRSPAELFSPGRMPPSLLRTGDSVKFRAISSEEFERISKGVRSNLVPSAAEGTRLDLTPCFEVIKPGLLTTVQDLGRTGHRAAGVPLSGAMDAPALRAANRAVGNPEDAAGLEITMFGPELEFSGEVFVAVQGAEMEGLPSGEIRRIRAGERLNLGRAIRGCRSYLAVSGGIDVSPVLGSRSTYLRGGFGGFLGRALRAGDRLGAVEGVRPQPRLGRGCGLTPSPAVVRAIRGGHGRQFADAFFGTEFKLSPQSDRMGIRLEGGNPDWRPGAGSVSAAVAPGTVQMPPDGQPIVLMADAQTIGGYARAAHVASIDLPILAQLRPGECVRFKEISLAEAQSLLLAACQ